MDLCGKVGQMSAGQTPRALGANCTGAHLVRDQVATVYLARRPTRPHSRPWRHREDAFCLAGGTVERQLAHHDCGFPWNGNRGFCLIRVLPRMKHEALLSQMLVGDILRHSADPLLDFITGYCIA